MLEIVSSSGVLHEQLSCIAMSQFSYGVYGIACEGLNESNVSKTMFSVPLD
jgi:hypothetical protein